jgi:kynurenine formamidase
MTQDMPIPWMEERFKAGHRDAYFPVHLAGKREPYVHVEKANGLGRLPSPSGYRVAAFPVKVEGGSGAWARFHALRDLPFDPAEVEVVDLSQPIRRESMESESSIVRTHGSARRRRQWAKHLGVRTEEIEPRGAWDQVIASTRAGTHVAAPWRFGPSCNGRDARTIEDIPLDWCFGRGLVLDVSDGSPEQRVDEAEIVRAIQATGRSLVAGDIVLLRTGAEDHWEGDPAYPSRGRGLEVAALEYLVERGVRVVGTDAESLDAPLSVMVAARDLFPIHRAARRLEHVQVLKLGNLRALDRAADFWLSVAPIKVEAAGSGWARAVAFVPPSLEHRPAVAGQALEHGG